ncbi:hypothetical protein KBY96_07300 [Cyanobium sp. ATX 6A2]|uniref:hypothetical protein n=1 Tax=Cyanobium sp. ATX 6A2 TaxID=2823700 RepID=UPI0020CE82B8|nr:hypothetical protein [Cyanobium sp. ATX 6A2]MCP9887736.1 hypothetical protein [Cyanobium sp. ATX 6A2]
MVRPRWQRPRPPSRSGLERSWGRFVAVWASLNLVWVAFDLTYVAVRPFWLQRNLQLIPGVPLTVPLQVLPDITPWVDPIKGIEPHRETQAYLDQFERLDAALAGAAVPFSAEQRRLLEQQVELTNQMIDTNPFQGSDQSGTLEKIKNRLRDRADQDSSKQAAAQLLSPAWLEQRPWQQERLFWRDQVLPLVQTNYWRSIEENAQPTNQAWRIDLLLFQWVFLLDILLRVVRLRRRIPGLGWRDALLRRWIDLPLLLPFWRWLRIVPVVERLQTSRLVNFEPLRAVVSRGVVALLALELFEVLALQLIDGVQGLVRSPRWPQRIRSLRSHQAVIRSEDERQLLELLRIWGPLLLSEVAPRLAPELQSLLGYSLRQSLDRTVVPPPLRQLKPLLQLESGLSSQLAGGMVDSLLDLSRSTGKRLGRTDDAQLEMLQRCIDRFWDELALSLETGPALERSQELICALIEGLKSTYLSQISRARITSLIEELDQLMVSVSPSGEPGG